MRVALTRAWNLMEGSAESSSAVDRSRGRDESLDAAPILQDNPGR